MAGIYDFLTPQDRYGALGDMMLALGAGLMAGGAPSREPGGMQRGLAQGLLSANQASQRSISGAVQNRLLGRELQAEQNFDAAFGPNADPNNPLRAAVDPRLHPILGLVGRQQAGSILAANARPQAREMTAADAAARGFPGGGYFDQNGVPHPHNNPANAGAIAGSQAEARAPWQPYIAVPPGGFMAQPYRAGLMGGQPGAGGGGGGDRMAALAQTIEQAAREFGVDPALLTQLIRQESGGNPTIVSPAGTQGVGQFLPGTWDQAIRAGIVPQGTQRTDPHHGTRASAWYPAQQLQRFGGDVPSALAAYNWGPERVAGLPGQRVTPEMMGRLPVETRNYIAAITGGRGQPQAGPNVTAQAGSPIRQVAPGVIADTRPNQATTSNFEEGQRQQRDRMSQQTQAALGSYRAMADMQDILDRGQATPGSAFNLRTTAGNFLSSIGASDLARRIAGDENFALAGLSSRAVLDAAGGSLGTAISNADAERIASTVPQPFQNDQSLRRFISLVQEASLRTIHGNMDVMSRTLPQGIDPIRDITIQTIRRNLEEFGINPDQLGDYRRQLRERRPSGAPSGQSAAPQPAQPQMAPQSEQRAPPLPAASRISMMSARELVGLRDRLGDMTPEQQSALERRLRQLGF